MKAWLITWEWLGEAAAVADKVAAILNSRWSVQRVSDIVEFLYAHYTSTLSEVASYAKSPKNNPCRAKQDFNSQITCGYHPWLWARNVDDLRISVDERTRIETITWKEVPIYEASDKGLKLLRGHIPSEYTRHITGHVLYDLIWDHDKGTYKDWWLEVNGKRRV